jgi:long-chain acyl-CoA synthetase
MESTAAEALVAPPAPGARTLCQAFQLTAAERADQVALRTPGDAVTVTYREYAERVRRIAGGLASLGVARGDTVALMLFNRPEFNLVDTAAVHLGAIPFSIYNTSAPEQIEYLFSNAGNRVAVTERALLPQIRTAVRRGEVSLERVVVVDGAEDGTIALAELEEAEPAGFDFEAAWRAVTPEDILTLIYTSGTTGAPKGVQLTHANMMAEVRGTFERLPVRAGGRVISFLPSAHVADRWSAHYFGSHCLGFTVTCVADLRTVVQHLPEVRPTAWGAVPRIWEKIKAALEAQGVVDPGALREEQRAAIRARLGLDQAQWSVVEAAPTAREVLEYFDALGLPICELWGMSELSCCVTINPPERIKIGTLRVADRGRRAAHRRRRRSAGARPAGDGGLPQRAGEDGADDRPRRVAPHRRHRRARRGRLPDDRRPQEGADHQRGRQEHVAGEHRVAAEGRQPADRPVHLRRRPAPLQRRPDRPRPGRLRRPRPRERAR